MTGDLWGTVGVTGEREMTFPWRPGDRRMAVQEGVRRARGGPWPSGHRFRDIEQVFG